MEMASNNVIEGHSYSEKLSYFKYFVIDSLIGSTLL